MGILNRDNALYMATGIDNSGLAEDAEQGKKIVRDMTNSIVQQGNKMKEGFEVAGQGVVSITDRIKDLKAGITQTESDIKRLQNTFENAAPGKAKLFAIQELNAAKKALQEDKVALEELEAQMNTTSAAPASLRSQIRQLKEEMSRMQEGTQDYTAAMKKLGELTDLQGDIAAQGKVFGDDERNIRSTVEAVNLLSGAMSAGVGVASLFGAEDEKLTQIQTRLQSVMAITIGLQQVATTLNKDSYFSRVLLAKANDLLTASTARLSIALGISNVAAKALMATLTLGLSIAITALIVLWQKHSDSVSAAAERQKQAQKQISDAINSVSGTMADQMVTLHNLIRRWDSLGDSLKKKKKFVEDNKDAFHSLGITVNTVNEAENALVKNTGSVIKAMQLRAQAAAYQKIAQEEYEKMAKAELQAQFIESAAPIEDDFKKTRQSRSVFDAGSVSSGSGNKVNATEAYYDKSDMANAEANRKKRAEEIRINARMHLIWGNHVMKSADELNSELSKDLSSAGINEYNGSDTYQKDKDAAKKAQEEAIKLREQTDKYKVLLSKQSVEEKRAAEDLQTEVDESRIKTMDEGSKKTIAQMEFNFEKEMQAIDRQKEDALRKKVDDARSAFEANPKNKGKSFDASGIALSSEDIKRFDELYKNGIAGFEKAQSDFDKNSKLSWSEYLKEFGTYLEKRKAIQDLYKDKIDNAQTDGEKATLNKKMQNELDELDNSVRNSATLMGQLFADASRKSVNEIQAIINKSELLMKYLETIKDEQGNATISGKKVSKNDILNLGVSDNTLQNLEKSTQEIESLRNAIMKLKGELGSKSPFIQFKKDLKDAIDKIKSGGNNNIAQGISDVGSAVSAFSPAVEQFGQDLGNIFGSDDLGNKISGIAGAVGGLGQTAVGVGQIMSGDIVGGAMSAVSGISKVVTSLDGLFGANYDKYNKAKEEYESYINILDDVIERQKEMVASLDNANATKSYEYAKSLIDKSADSARELGRERLNAGASAGSHSIGVRQRKDMSTQAWNEAKSALGSAFNQYGIGDGRMTGLFDLSVDQLKKLQDEAPTFWAKLDGDVRGYLEDIIKANKSAEELKDTLNENLTGMSFDSLFDNFLDSLYDVKSTAEEISDDMADNMRKSIIKAFVVDNYKDKLKEWYNLWAQSLQDGSISSDEQKSLDDLKNSIINGATESAKLINDQFSYLNDGKESGVTGKVEAALTEGTASEVLGVMNMGALDLRVLKEMTAEHFKDYATEMNYISNLVDEARQINANTKRTADNTDGLIDKLDTGFKDLKSELSEIKKNTKDTSGR